MSQSENILKKPKICFLLDHPKENHYKFDNNNVPQNVYLSTYPGRTLKALTGKDGLQLDKDQWYFDYAYSKMPKVTKRDRYGKALSYKPTSAKEEKEEFPFTEERILKEKPDVIIPMGNVACSFIFNKKSIVSLRGKPEKRLLDDNYEPWVLPTFSPEYVLVQKNKMVLLNADFTTLDKFLREGESAFIPEEVKYNFVDTMEKVRHIFNELTFKTNITAWDLETNTLKPWLKGAKAIVLSLSTKEGEGFTVPLEHKAFTKWSKENVDEIYELLEHLVKDKTRTKVGHNLSYDLKFLRFTRGFTEFNNNLDTKVMYYLLVNQDVKGSLKLSDMSYELTTIGGYDKGLESYKSNFIQGWKENEKARVEEEYQVDCNKLLKEYEKEVEEWEEEKELIVQRHNEEVVKWEEQKQYNKDNSIKEKLLKPKRDMLPRKPKKPLMPKKGDYKVVPPPVNEIDGSDFNYEWIPLIEMLHPYASGDTDACIRIYNHLHRLSKKMPKQKELYEDYYPELISTLVELEYNGVKLDVDYNIEMSNAYDEKFDELVEEIRKFDIIKDIEADRYYLYEKGLEEWTKPKLSDALKKKLERDGVDLETINEKDYRDEDIASLRDKYKEDKWKFNPKSGDDRSKLFYEKLGFTLPFENKYLKKSAITNGVKEKEVEWHHYKTSKDAIEALLNYDSEYKDLLKKLLEFSAVSTIKSGFTHKLREMRDDNDIVHPNFNSTGTETSRLSSSNFNAQNLPSKTSKPNKFSYKQPIKRMFISRFENGVILQADYSSLESRVMALYSGDNDMTRAFMNGKDVHRETAALMNNITEEEVTDEQRQSAKAINFGIAYGEHPFSFAPKNTSPTTGEMMTVAEAEEIFEKYYANKPKIKEAIDRTHKEVKRNGYVETMSGFRRNLKNVTSMEKSKQNEALRQSFNTIIQGTGAYLTNKSLILLNRFINSKGLKSKLIMTVHDSIVIDCHPDEIKLMAKVCKYIMENIPADWLYIDWEGEKIRYPITTDVEIGMNYNDAVDYDEELFVTFNSSKGYCKYKNDLKHIKNYFESKLISEEKYNQLKSSIESKIEKYKLI